MFSSLNQRTYTFSTPVTARAHRQCLSVVYFILIIRQSYTMVPNCPFYIMVPNCPWCQIVRNSKLSMVPNCPRCQIVWCQIVCGAKLSGAKLSVVPNCPQTVPNCPIVGTITLAKDMLHKKQRQKTKKTQERGDGGCDRQKRRSSDI